MSTLAFISAQNQSKVMTKGHATVLETSGLGLGDVVEQRGQANDEVGRGLGDDGDRVGI